MSCFHQYFFLWFFSFIEEDWTIISLTSHSNGFSRAGATEHFSVSQKNVILKNSKTVYSKGINSTQASLDTT
jgi:hypothetical protein